MLYYFYTIRNQISGEAIYCGLTTNVKKRWYSHKVVLLKDEDIDEYKLYVLFCKECKSIKDAIKIEIILSERLETLNEPLRNRYFGCSCRDNIKKEPYQIYDIISKDGKFLLSVITKQHANLRNLLRNVFEDNQYLKNFDKHQCYLKLVTEKTFSHEAALKFANKRTKKLIKSNTYINSNNLIQLYRFVIDDYDKLEISKNQALTRHNNSKYVYRCIETNDLFSCSNYAADWSNCGGSEVNRACKEPSRTAGGFHWEKINKLTLTSKQINMIHDPPVVREYYGLQKEHADESLKVPSRFDLSPKPSLWIIDTIQYESTHTEYHIDCISCIVNITKNSFCISYSTPSQSWLTFAYNNDYYKNDTYIVHSLSTNYINNNHLPLETNIKFINKLRKYFLHNHFNIIYHKNGFLPNDSRQKNTFLRRLQNLKTVILCVETGILFPTGSSIIKTYSLQCNDIGYYIHNEESILLGYHWKEIEKSTLTSEQQEFIQHAITSLVEGNIREFYIKHGVNVNRSPYISHYIRTGISEEDLYRISNYLVDVNIKNACINGELPISKYFEFKCSSCGKVISKTIKKYLTVNKCQSCICRSSKRGPYIYKPKPWKYEIDDIILNKLADDESKQLYLSKYININSRFNIECECCHKIYQVDIHHLFKHQFTCKSCIISRKNFLRSIDINLANHLADDTIKKLYLAGDLVFRDTQLISFKCECGNTFETTLRQWKFDGQRECRQCVLKRLPEVRKKKKEERKRIYEQEVLTLLNGSSKKEYLTLKDDYCKNYLHKFHINCKHCSKSLILPLYKIQFGDIFCDDCKKQYEKEYKKYFKPNKMVLKYLNYDIVNYFANEEEKDAYLFGAIRYADDILVALKCEQCGNIYYDTIRNWAFEYKKGHRLCEKCRKDR